MSPPNALRLRCEDFLKDNTHLYAHKARRKKIALILVDAAADSQSEEVRIDLGTAKLMTANTICNVEPPDRVIRKFSEFTWDFLVYLVLDFHLLLSAVDMLALLSGPIYNRRLKRQLSQLSNGDMILKPGESKKAVLAFRAAPSDRQEVHLNYRVGDSAPLHIECEVH